jgi:TPR repeat protein
MPNRFMRYFTPISIFLLLLLSNVMVEGQQPGLPADLAAGAAKATGEMRANANKGDAFSQWNMGFICGQGQGVPKSEVEAAKWFRKAADQGYAPAQYNLGLLYLSGQGVAQSNLEAYKCFLIGARLNNASAQSQVNQLEPKLTPAELAEGQRCARLFKVK